MKKILWRRSVTALLLVMALILPELFTLNTQAASTPLTDQTANFVSGNTYVIASSGSIKDDQNKSLAHCAVLGVPVAKKGETEPDGLGYAPLPESDPTDEFLWKITDEGNGYYALYSLSQKKYMKLEGGKVLLTAEKSTVKGVFSGGEVHFMNDAGEYLRFTNVDNSRYQCNSLNARKLKLFGAIQIPEEYKETGEPLLSVACFSDMHHEYGIQYWNPPYRKSTQNAVNYIKNTLGKVDVLLVGGDVTGRRNNSAGNNLTWTGGANVINNLLKANYEFFQSATKDGAVMVVTGNHDPEPSVHMSGGYTSANSNDWAPYMEQGVGDFEVSVTYSDLKLSTEGIPSQYQNEVLCYRYTVNGIPFIGLNTPFGDRTKVGQTGHNGIYVAQIEWLEAQLNAIGKDKTAVVFCHYPVTSMPTVVNGGATKQVISSNSEAQNKINSVLSKFPNAIYAYGHIHGDNSRIAKYTTSELVFPSQNATQQADNSYKTNGWISAFMGSLGFYGNSHQNKLSDEELKVVQFLVMDFYEDHITFRLHNTGSLYAPGGAKDLVSFTVQRDLSAQLDGSSESTDSNEGSTSTSTSTVISSVTNTDSDSQDTDTPSDTDSSTNGSESTEGTVTDTADSSASETTQTTPSTESEQTTESKQTTDSTAKEEDSSGSVVLWIVIGGIVLLALAGGGVWLLMKKVKAQ
ncbi:MAG: metallophosphoesterase [Clostridia bacterium]|nr:metallophosphoesterase [Clostridia bacterium]